MAKSSRFSAALQFLMFWGPTVLLVLAAFWVTSRFVQPAPPKHAVIVTGREDGEYYAMARKYAAVFKANGIELEVRPSAGSVENYEQLLKENGDVDLAIVQGGTLSEENRTGGKLEGVASLYLEPMWVFYRDDNELDRLSQLAGRQISIGADGSGTQVLATMLLRECGITPANPANNTAFLHMDAKNSTQAIIDGKIDAAIMVASPNSPLVHDLLTTPGVRLMNFSQAGALSRKCQFLSNVTLYRGSIDLPKNLPAADVQLVAPAAMLVARESSHKALVLLGAMAAAEMNKYGTLLSEPGQFPTARYMEPPMAKEAVHFLEKGPSLLQRFFPFAVASFLDRMLIMLLPFVTLLIPIVRFAPPLYVWRTRSRIYRWYKQIRAIDEQLTADATRDALKEHLMRIEKIEAEVRSVHVPLSYMEELYNLRLHINLVEQKVREQASQAHGI